MSCRRVLWLVWTRAPRPPPASLIRMSPKPHTISSFRPLSTMPRPTQPFKFSAALQQKRHAGYITDLPKLGVPSLEETVAKLLAFAQLVLDPADFEATQKEAADFLRDENARKLQDLLQQRALRLDNWLTPWWLDAAYLTSRAPLPIVTSPGLCMAFYDFEGEEGQLEYAAKFIQATLDFRKMIDDKTLKQDGSLQQPMDMSQFDNLFGTTRIPRPGKDQLRYGRDSPNQLTHIIITRNGHTFKFPVYTKDGQPLGLEQIVQNIRDHVLPQSQVRHPEPIQLLSAGDRETWAPVYKRIAKNNAAEIEAFEDALFVLGLDEGCAARTGQTRRDASLANALHGGGAAHNTPNRYFDKCLNLFVGADGALGLCYEHSPAEGPPVARLADYVQERLREARFRARTDTAAFQPQKVNWRLTELDRRTLSENVRKVDEAAHDVELCSVEFADFGQNLAKEAKVSPDSLIQLALQCAYYRLHRAHVPTYETATLRKFRQGRTDTIRLPNAESAAFVEGFVGETQRKRPQDQVNDLVKACNAHKRYALMAMEGKAMDRHILGWKMIAAENGIQLPPLLQGHGLRRLLQFQISTSQVPTRHELHLCFGPSEPDGYGICYNPAQTRIFFTISAQRSHAGTSAQHFGQELVGVLRDFRQLMLDSGRVQLRNKL